jgi:alpha-ketoglutaric semialdehyde dehydrogenase
MEGEGIDQLKADMKAAFNQITPACMLNKGIYQNFENKKGTMLKEAGVEVEFQFDKDVDVPNARPAIASVNAVHFLMNEKLQEEVFGPFTLLVTCRDEVEFLKVANHFAGQLTATIMGEEGELTDHADLFAILQEKVGRLIFNGVPTGVEVVTVCSTAGLFRPLPTAASLRSERLPSSALPVRWLFRIARRPLLPDELKDDNPLNIVRVVDGEWRTA